MSVLPANTEFPRVTPMFVFGHPVHCLAFGLGLGLSPKAPGTVGTILGLPLYLVLRAGLGDGPILLAALLLLFGLGIKICGITGQHLGEHDHGGIVFDEIVAYAMVLAWLPPEPIWWLAGFAAFRFFDIVKPFPIQWVDTNWANGFGVMFDDLLAAGYATLLLLPFH